MKSPSSVFLIIFACSIFLLSSSASAQDVTATSPSDATGVDDQKRAETWTLKYRFLKNETLRYVSHQTMKLTTTLESGTQVDVSEFRQQRSFRVKDVDADGRATLEMAFEHVRMEKKTGDAQQLIYESTMKPADVPGVFRQVDHEVRKLKTNFYLNPDGTSAFEQLVSQTSVRPPGDNSSVHAAASFIDAEADDESVRTVSATAPSIENSEKDAGTFLLTLPDHPVRVGATWKHVATVPVRVTAEINRNIQILRTFRLDSVEGDIAIVSFRSSIESPLRTPAVRSQLIQALPKGTMKFDMASGRMVTLRMLHNQSVFGAMTQNGVLECNGESIDTLMTDASMPEGSSVNDNTVR
ncbi:MAG: hypothetical protein ACK58L_11185 [Planctomycetota bacterium]